MKVAVIGSGQVGKRIGKTFGSRGNEVIFFDVNTKAFEGIEGHETTLDIKEAIGKSDISFIAVPTPVDENGAYDTSFVAKASAACGEALKDTKKYHVFVIKSTVTPGTTEDVVITNIEKSSGKKSGEDFGVVYNPEFLTVIEKSWTDDESFHIDSDKEGRIVLGEGVDKKAGDIIERFYNDTIFEFILEKISEDDGKIVYKKIRKHVPVFRTDYKTAEMTKLVANNRLPLAISYMNEIFLFSEELKKNGLAFDTKFIADMVSKDPRIGKYGSVYGKAWGGPCFKKDTVAFRRWLEDVSGRKACLINNTIELNEEMKIKFGVRE